MAREDGLYELVYLFKNYQNHLRLQNNAYFKTERKTIINNWKV